MRLGRSLLIFMLAACPAIAAPQEAALVIRAGDLMAQPFIDAPKVGPVGANQPATILERRGGWVKVQINGKTGWLRTLNLRLAPGASATAGRPANALTRSAALLRTGSSGKTVTTGVKGLNDEDIRNAAIDPEQQAKLDTLAVPESAARDAAARKKLVETKLDYLKPGKGK
ncbi:MAG: SH3 domain-containing protein [Pseudomonadota bacterium]